MRLIHEQHPHRRIELVICIIDGCSAGCDAGNHKVGIGNGHHDVELCVGDRGAKVSGISLLRRERELEKKITTHIGWLYCIELACARVECKRNRLQTKMVYKCFDWTPFSIMLCLTHNTLSSDYHSQDVFWDPRGHVCWDDIDYVIMNW